MSPQKILISIFGVAVLITGLYFLFFLEEKEYHVHADFRVVVLGTHINFSDTKYMTEGSHYLHKYVHVHDGDGDVIHFHSKDVRLGDFFTSLGFQLNSTCFKLDTNATFCNDAKNVLRMYVNGEQNSAFGKYKPRDLDRILVIYGDGIDDQKELTMVTDKACIQSGICPERGNASNENMSCGPNSFCIL